MPLWLLKGSPDATGWTRLEQDARADTINVLHFDSHAWALIKQEQSPSGYDGLTPGVPSDGNYLDQFGRPCYVLGAREVHSARVVINGLDDEARKLLDKVGDADLVLERLGRVF